ncbi:MAG: DUF2752 domain-containing protein [Clostridia bacterium]|nr:DUF2752 domain-containing protein [Clostridia bacterium]MBQ3866974.1 DUF2752 domain-containing protein [Clostridia bacterium]
MTGFQAFKGRIKAFFQDRGKVIRTAVLLAVGAGYYVLYRLTGLGLPCVFHKITGLYCPGCGVTRMVVDLSRLRFAKAFSDNAVLFVLLPVWLAAMLILLFRRDSKRLEETRTFKILSIVSLILLIVFGVLRNLPAFRFLRP